ncbi:MAG: phosphoadenylyl-sulfate reductase [Verrucomicrobiota bacterium]
MNELLLESTGLDLADLSAEERVDWAVAQFPGEVILSTSFGVQSAVLLHMVGTRVPKVPVVFVDTGYLFPETYRFADRLTRELDLDLRTYTPVATAAQQEALFGKRWEGSLDDLDAYNKDTKIEPMNRALRELGASAWISGLRRAQSEDRSKRSFVELQNKTYKIYPILDWTDRDIYQYLTEHDLPYHPLWEQGYATVGDWHSSAKLTEGLSEEATRFGGRKRECGLHELTGGQDFQI